MGLDAWDLNMLTFWGGPALQKRKQNGVELWILHLSSLITHNPAAWVDFCRVLVREKRDDAKQISVIVIASLISHHSQPCSKLNVTTK
jgi:hypothetical protein